MTESVFGVHAWRMSFARKLCDDNKVWWRWNYGLEMFLLVWTRTLDQNSWPNGKKYYYPSFKHLWKACLGELRP
ncbi:hypothetical protein TNCV_4412461 [Trichonephila clavipes]|nr:hypothetical protein TNCV_4412461 [Trichonephila clavipes]